MPSAFLIMAFDEKAYNREYVKRPEVLLKRRARGRAYMAAKRKDPTFREKSNYENMLALRVRYARERIEVEEQWPVLMTEPKWRSALIVCALQRNAALKRPFIWRKPTITPGKLRKTKAERRAAANRTARAYVAKLKSDPIKGKEYRERMAAYVRKYRRVNKEKISARLKERMENNPAFKLSKAIRSAVGKGIKRATGNPKTERTSKLIGCSFQFLVKHLESQFQTGMSWATFGKQKGCWSIDHIRPLASFDLNDVSQRHEAFCYKNLQPKWHVENISKSSNWNGRRWSYSHHKQGAIKYA